MRLLGERGPCERRFALRGLALQLALRLLRCRAASQRGGTQVREGLARVRPWARMQGRARLCCRGRSRRRPGAQTDALRRSWQICVQFPRVLVHEANRGLERAGYGAEAAGRFLVRLHAVARPPPDQAGQLPAPLFSSVSLAKPRTNPSALCPGSRSHIPALRVLGEDAGLQLALDLLDALAAEALAST